MDIFHPSGWPVPQIDLWFAGLRDYYGRFMAANAETGPFIVWAFYFVLSWLAHRLPWVKTNKIPELVVSIFRGDWLKWWRNRKAASAFADGEKP